MLIALNLHSFDGKEIFSKSLRALSLVFRRTWIVLLIPLAWILTDHFGYAINLSESLPQKVWIVHLHKTPKRGDYIVFRAPLQTGLGHNSTLIKQVRGVPGDVVTNLFGHFFINDEYIAQAKSHSLTGKPLIPGFEGRLKEGEFYVHSPHPDSFDSRYKAMGLIHADTILGVAYALW
ncbi:MAG: S26 family signal peptidase [Gammaproteobacteria bacterium]|nr:S26 family signal peptidase [Gammaproteobacteria bacterium]